jgi:hypothetical protein
VLTVLIALSAAMGVAWLVAERTGRSGWIDAIWTFAAGLAGMSLRRRDSSNARRFPTPSQNWESLRLSTGRAAPFPADRGRAKSNSSAKWISFRSPCTFGPPISSIMSCPRTSSR